MATGVLVAPRELLAPLVLPVAVAAPLLVRDLPRLLDLDLAPPRVSGMANLEAPVVVPWTLGCLVAGLPLVMDVSLG